MAKLGLALAHAFARLAVILSTLELASGNTLYATAWASVAGAAFLFARGAGALLRSRREIELSHDLLRHVLHSDLFANPLRGKQDTVIAGLYEAARMDTQVVPAMVADVIVATFVVVFAVTHHDGVRLLAFLIGLFVGAGVVFAARRFAWRASMRAWGAREAHLKRVLDGLEGATEIVSASAVERFEMTLTQSMREARRASWIVGFESTIVGRLPVIVGIALAVLVAYAMTGAIAPTRAVEWSVIAAMLAPFAGVAAASATLIETRGVVSAVRTFLEQKLRSDGSGVPTGIDAVILEGVTVRYSDVDALHGVDLRCASGLTVLAGNNGSGKSTILRLLSGLVTAVDGQVIIGAVSSAEICWQALRQRMSFLAQRPYVPVDASVRDCLTFLFELSDVACRAALERADAWQVLREKSAADPLATKVDALSAGERQRVVLARTLSRDVELYLFDEPDANLDHAGIKTLCEILKELAAHAVVIVAAHTPEIIAIADHVIELNQGRVVRDERRDEPRALAVSS